MPICADLTIDKIKKKDAKIAIFGMGYVGLPLALLFVDSGFEVIGFDVDEEKVKSLNSGKSYIEHISKAEIQEASTRGFMATTDFSKAHEPDVLIICVPTPLNKFREPDLRYILDTLASIKPYLRKGQAVVLESTTYPGTTEEVVRPIIENEGHKVGEDIFLIFSPEREDPGNPDYSTRTIPKICSGVTSNCLEVAMAVYSMIIEEVVPVSSTRTAEMTKLLENIHRAVNIGLVNEMKIVADTMGIDIHEVIRAAATKPFGFNAYYPGPGIGGHCIPVDPFYLTWKAREYGLHTRFIELAGEINASMPQYVLQKTSDALNRHSKAIKGSRIHILGIAYKKNVDDMRESPAVVIMELLREKGAILSYSDPHVPKFPRMRQHSFNLESQPLDPKSISQYDCLILTTDHDSFPYAELGQHARLIVDTRGIFRGNNPNIIKA